MAGSIKGTSSSTSELLKDYWSKVGCVGNYDLVSKYVGDGITTKADGSGSLMNATDIINNFNTICSSTTDPLHTFCSPKNIKECGTNVDVKFATFKTSTCACSLL